MSHFYILSICVFPFKPLPCYDANMKSADDLIGDGQVALNAGDWNRARLYFEGALKAEDNAEAHDGLGLALWWLNEIKEAHRHRSIAYASFKKQGQLGRAAWIASWLAREQVFLHSNLSAMKGWFARASRLLSQAGHCAEEGWYIILRASMLASPDELEQAATQAIKVAREFNDEDLEAVALAFSGMARISLGRVDEGMACLDEAMVEALGGEIGSFMAISEIFCVTLSGCELAGDLTRTEHWCQSATEFAQRHNCSFLSAYCRTTYGGLLTATGRWHEAEKMLLEAISAFETGHRGLRVHAVLKLAELHICQGRLEEAESLLAGYEDYGAAVAPLARLHLARGEASMAQAILEQALHSQGPRTLNRAPLLLLLVEVWLAIGDTVAAQTVADELAELAKDTGSDLLLAQADLARGQVKRHAGDLSAAGYLQSALDRLRSYEQSLLASRARLEMARLLIETDWAGAVTWARAALASFERIGARHDADEAAKLLRQLGFRGRSGPRLQGQLTQREVEVLALVRQGLTNKEIAERLFISAKTAEHHVGQILSKLGARSRAEAVAFGANLKPDS
jgi:ATP/maltotriose-dependent transcriptional regulator MalT